ncbi:type II toxin-antitoxin system HicB family antitoxin [Megamonas hypermegale]|uniref:type II toxin-antitoxin system HicB family antitoxin n=1 Tax=Megamonas hypermegale TaxID=158847 RepID=UPI0026F04BCF|nr:type II toxin-antitoxin system HicB family antitoxin [Megamonas hypermegale]
MEKMAYPVIFEKENDGYFVTVPDLNINTQGENLPEAIMMARDLISLYILDNEEEGKKIALPNTVKFELSKGAILSYVDIDMASYRKKYGSKTVKKNCTIPAWLNNKAEELNINFSKTLQEALMKKIS